MHSTRINEPAETNVSNDTLRTTEGPGGMSPPFPSVMRAMLGAPLWMKLTGTNALIVAAAVAAVRVGASQGENVALLERSLLGTLAAALLINIALVLIALRPLRTLERTAAEVQRGNTTARVPESLLADRDMARVGHTLNLLVDTLVEDRARSRELAALVISQAELDQLRIAHELHESAAQRLAAQVMQISAIARDTGDAHTRASLEELRAMASDTLEASAHPRDRDSAPYAQRFRRAGAERSQDSARGGAQVTELIDVMLVDDHAIVRTGLKAVLSSTRDIRVIGEASSGTEAVFMAQRLKPHVVIMDLTMPGGDGVTATKSLVALEPAPKVLVLTMHTEEEYLMPTLKAGASGYLVKSSADRELVDAIRAVVRGEMYVQQNAGRVLARGFTAKDPAGEERARFEKLTDRERDVLVLVARGYSAPEIGERLSISPKTVDTYKQRVNEKLGVAHRADYVRIAMRLGLLSEE